MFERCAIGRDKDVKTRKNAVERFEARGTRVRPKEEVEERRNALTKHECVYALVSKRSKGWGEKRRYYQKGRAKSAAGVKHFLHSKLIIG